MFIVGILYYFVQISCNSVCGYLVVVIRCTGLYIQYRGIGDRKWPAQVEGAQTVLQTWNRTTRDLQTWIAGMFISSFNIQLPQ